jgi:hypothetical protein
MSIGITNPAKMEINTIIVSIAHPDWGKWRITKIPTKREDWYHIRGASGEHMEDEYELRRFWKVVE